MFVWPLAEKITAPVVDVQQICQHYFLQCRTLIEISGELSLALAKLQPFKLTPVASTQLDVIERHDNGECVRFARHKDLQAASSQ